MSKLVEVAEFIDEVLRLDADTPVKGYDGNDIGPANEQAQVLANRTQWLKKQIVDLFSGLKEIGSKEYVISVNDKKGTVNIAYSDVGAAAKEHQHTPSDIKVTDDAQFVTSDEKKEWSGKQDVLVSSQNIKTLNDKTLLGEGNITLTADDVNADKTGTAEEAITAHVAEDDPHSQYLIKDVAKNTYVPQDSANKPLGYVRLDENGYLPTDIATLYEAHYYIADNEEDRLKISEHKNIVICLQVDNDKIYYLNPNTDPSVNENWSVGGNNVINNVVSIYGRSGIVEAKEGDYTADQITETESRTFMTPAERSTWDGKQDALVSGESIKKLNGDDLLGSGNITIDIDTLGAAAKEHTHEPDDIKTNSLNRFVTDDEKTTWSGKQDKLIKGKNFGTIFGQSLLDGKVITLGDADDFVESVFASLKAGDGVTILFDEVNNNITLGLKAGDVDTGLPTMTVEEVNGAKANTEYRFSTKKGFNFNFIAHALKENIKMEESTIKVAYADLLSSLPKTDLPTFDQDGNIPIGSKSTYSLAASEDEKTPFITAAISLPDGATYFGLDMTPDLIPVFNKDTTDPNITPISSQIYSGFYPWKAYQAPLTEEERKKVPNYGYWSDGRTWNQANGADVYLGFTSTKETIVDSYGFQNFESMYWTSTSTPPTDWYLQGRNEDTDDWTTVDYRLDQTIQKPGDTWSVYTLDKPVSYKQFRILIQGVANKAARPAIPRLQFYHNLYALIKDANGVFYTLSEDATIEKVKSELPGAYATEGVTGKIILGEVTDDGPVFPITVCANQGGDVTAGFYTSSKQIVIHNPIKDLTTWESLRDFAASQYTNEKDGERLKLAFTLDGSNYRVFRNNTWDTVGEINNDTLGATLLLNNGMTFDEVNALGQEEWESLTLTFDGNSHLGVAYGSLMLNKQDSRVPKEISLEFGRVSDWAIQSPDKVAITLSKVKIVFKPSEDGNYKFCYNFVESTEK